MRDNTRYSQDIRYQVWLDTGEHAASWSDAGSGGAGSITASTTHVTGAHSVSFAKVSGDTDAVLIKTLNRGAGVDLRPFALNGRIGLSIYISSIANVSAVKVFLMEDSSNYVTYTIADSSLSAGWNHLSVDTISGSQTGTGIDWKAVKYVSVGVIFDNASDTLSGILLDHVVIELPDVSVEIDSSSTLPVSVTNTPNVVVTGTTTVSGEVSILDQPVDVTGSTVTVDSVTNPVTVSSISNTVTVDGEVSITEDPLNVNVNNSVALSDLVSPGTTYSGEARGVLAMGVRDDDLVPKASDDQFSPLLINEDGALLTKSVGGSSISPTQGREYFNDVDFTVSYASSSGVSLDGLSFTPTSEMFLGLFAHTTGSGLRFYDPVTYEFRYDSSTDTLNIGGEGTSVFLGSNDDFKVVLSGPERAYTQATDSVQTSVTNPDWEHYSSSTLADVTNGTDGTYSYYLDMSSYKNLSLQFNFDGGSGTISGTVYMSVQDDGTAASSCSYVEATNDLFGVTAFSTSSAENFIGVDNTGIAGGAKYVKVQVETYTGGANDSDWTIYSKQW